MDEDIKTTNEKEDENGETELDTGQATETTASATEELKDKLAATHERLLRTAAELDNVRKRARRDMEDAVQRGRADVLMEVVPVIDSVDLALSSIDEKVQSGIVEGLRMIKRQFLTAMERFGVKPIESCGKAFDPNHHEAVLQVHSDVHPAGLVVDEMRKGYLIGEKLLRPAMVTVSRGAPPTVSSTDGTPSEESAPADTKGKMSPDGSPDQQ